MLIKYLYMKPLLLFSFVLLPVISLLAQYNPLQLPPANPQRLAALETIASKDQLTFEQQLERVRLHLQGGRFTRARQLTQQLPKKNNLTPQQVLLQQALLGDVYSAAYQRQKATKQYQKVLAMDSTHYHSYYSLAVLLQYEDISKALDLLEQYHQKTTGSSDSYLFEGMLHYHQANFTACEQAMNQALKLDSSNERARFYRGFARYAMEDDTGFEDILQVKERYLKQEKTPLDDGELSLLYYLLAEDYIAQDSLEEAYYWYDNASHNYEYALPMHHFEGLGPYWGMGDVHLMQEDTTLALMYYYKQLKAGVAQENPYTYEQVAFLFQELGYTKTAATYYKKIANLYYQDPDSWQHPLILAAMGEWALMNKKLEEAEQFLSRAINNLELYQDCFDYFGRFHYLQAQVLLAQQQYKAAEDYCQQAGTYGYASNRLADLQAEIEQARTQAR